MTPAGRITLMIAAAGAVAVAGARSAPESVETRLWRISASSFHGYRGGEEFGDAVDVVIEQDSLRVTSLRGRWNQSTGVATLVGEVRITEGSSTVTGDSAVFYRDTGYGTIVGHVEADDGAFRATADTAHVDRPAERVSLLSNATVHDEQGRIQAGRIDYDRGTGVAVAQGNVVALDDRTGSTVSGDRLVYNSSSDFAVVTGEPRLTTVPEGGLPMLVRAEELRLYRARGLAEAYRRVRIWQGNVRAEADEAVFNDEAGWVQLTGSPRAWDPDGRIAADTLVVRFDEREVHEVEAFGRASIVQAPTSGPSAGERTLAFGERAVAYFSGGAADSLLVEGDATSEYFPSPADLADGTGVNHSRARRIYLYLTNGQVDRVVLRGDAIGRYWFASENGSVGRAPGTAPAPDSTGAGMVAAADSAIAATTAAPDSSAGAAAIPDSIIIAPARVPPGAALPGGVADSVRVLTMSRLLAPPSLIDSTAAPVDSAAADSIAWVARVGDLDSIAPPDTLFPGGMDQVTYAGEEVEYISSTRSLEIHDGASIQYQDAHLKAGRVVYDVAGQTIEASDGPTLADPGGQLVGLRMDYDVEARKGVAHHGRTEFDGGRYYGRRIKKISDDTLIADHCIYTTCDREHPHFHFLAPQMKIRLRDKVIGRPVVLYLADIPVLAAPYFLFPIRKGRRSGILLPEVEFGFSTNRGRFLRNLGYYWAASDYIDAMAWLDVFERRPRWIGYFRGRYNQRYVLNGEVYGSFGLDLPERTSSFDDPTSTSRRWEFRARHAHTLSPSASLKLDANFVSDQNFLLEQDIGTSVEQQVDRILRSNLAFSKSWPGASLTLTASRRQDLEAGPGDIKASNTLPSLSFSLSRRTLGRAAQGRDRGFLPFLSSVTYGYSLRAEQTLDEIQDDSPVRESAMSHDVSVSDSRKVLGAISISPRFNYTYVIFEEDNRGDHWVGAGRWSTGVGASTTLYGTVNPNLGPLMSFRHVMSPSVSFSYQPEITSGTFRDEDGKLVPRFSPVGGISFGNTSRARRMSISVQNRFQAKVKKGEEIRRINELANLSLSTSYNFEAEERPWAPLQSTLRVRPVNAFNVDLSMTHDVYEWSLSRLSLSSNLSVSGVTAAALPAGTEFSLEDEIPGRRTGLLGEREATGPQQPWRLSLGHTYSRGADAADFQSTLRGQLTVSPTRNWQLSYSLNANLREKEISSHSFSVNRDLHCWQARFERRFFGGGASYYFRIGVKDIQEIFYEQRR